MASIASLTRRSATLLGSAARRSGSRMVHTEILMKEKGIVLPAYQDAVHNYVKGQSDGNGLIYIGDHVGQEGPHGEQVTVRGKVGEGADAEVSPEQAYDLARNAGLRLLATVNFYCDGDLDRVEQVVKLTGIVNAEPDFKGHGKVINGTSDLLVEALGDRGRHARTCTGAGSLPAAVTCELIVRIRGPE
jgi:enamine deaminase RidA (YjgF/YER057c/UK114 family)